MTERSCFSNDSNNRTLILRSCFSFPAVFSLTGLIVYGVGESDSDRLSSAFGLTFCAFLGALTTGAIFLWDKIHQIKKQKTSRTGFRGVSGIPSSRPGHRQLGSRLSHVRSTHGGSQMSVPNSQAQSVPKSTRHGGNASTGTELPPAKET